MGNRTEVILYLKLLPIPNPITVHRLNIHFDILND